MHLVHSIPIVKNLRSDNAGKALPFLPQFDETGAARAARYLFGDENVASHVETLQRPDMSVVEIEQSHDCGAE
jgi:hypothetical protein